MAKLEEKGNEDLLKVLDDSNTESDTEEVKRESRIIRKNSLSSLSSRTSRKDSLSDNQSESNSKTPVSSSRTKSTAVAPTLNPSEGRRSSRILTRKQRDSEIRLSFAKKLNTNSTKTNSTNNSPVTLTSKKNKSPYSSAVRVQQQKKILNINNKTSSTNNKKTNSNELNKNKSNSSSSGGGVKRKSNLEYSKNKKVLKKQNTYITFDDSDEDVDTSENEIYINRKQKGKIQQQQKQQQQQQRQRIRKQEISDDYDETDSDEDEVDDEEEEDDYDTDSDLEQEIKKALCKNVVKNEKTPKTVTNNSTKTKISQQLLNLKNNNKNDTKSMLSIRKNDNNNQTVATVRKINMFSNNSNNKKIESLNVYYPNNKNVVNKTLLMNKLNSLKTPPSTNNKLNLSQTTKPLNKSNSSNTPTNVNPLNKSNSSNTPTNSSKQKFDNESLSRLSFPLGSPSPISKQQQTPPRKIKSEFDKLVEDLFETESLNRKVNEIKETLIIDNEPTDVYTLSINDNISEDEDEYLESLCEEISEDEGSNDTKEQIFETSKLCTNKISQNVNKTNTTKTTITSSLFSKNKITFINDNNKSTFNVQENTSFTSLPSRSPNLETPKTKIINTKKLISSFQNNSSNKPVMSLKNAFISNKTPLLNNNNNNKTSSNNLNKTPSKLLNNKDQTPTNSPSNSSLINDKILGNNYYQEQYEKLHDSYEILSNKITQYMGKTKKEKEHLKKLLKKERERSDEMQFEIDGLKKKLDYFVNKSKLNIEKKKH